MTNEDIEGNKPKKIQTTPAPASSGELNGIHYRVEFCVGETGEFTCPKDLTEFCTLITGVSYSNMEGSSYQEGGAKMTFEIEKAVNNHKYALEVGIWSKGRPMEEFQRDPGRYLSYRILTNTEPFEKETT